MEQTSSVQTPIQSQSTKLLQPNTDDKEVESDIIDNSDTPYKLDMVESTPTDDNVIPDEEYDNKPTEIFRYKVVYPGGVCIRVSPSIDADKTVDVLEFGTIFRCVKSLVLDGVNYAKLADFDGWVFDRIGDIEVLELLDVTRRSPKYLSTEKNGSAIKNYTTTLNNKDLSPVARRLFVNSQHITVSRAQQEKEKLFQGVRNQNRFWREVRSKCNECIDFDSFIQLACGLPLQPPTMPEPGPARAAWVADSHRDEQVRSLISIITSITKQCTNDDDMIGLESCLWVLVHLGSRIAFVMNLAVEMANIKFDSYSPEKQSDILSILLEVASRTKAHCIELAKLVDILPDDIRNFLQRWVIIKSWRPQETEIEAISAVPSIDSVESVNEVVLNSAPTVATQPVVTTTDWLKYILCTNELHLNDNKKNKEMFETRKESNTEWRDGKFWNILERQMNKIKDPEYQFANLI
jgi:hypothetical protein